MSFLKDVILINLFLYFFLSFFRSSAYQERDRSKAKKEEEVDFKAQKSKKSGK